MAWHSLCDFLTPFLARVETPDGYGTGFLFGYNRTGKVAAIATAAHVVKYAHDWKTPLKLIHHQSGEELFLRPEDRVIFMDAKRDCASICLFLDKHPFPRESLQLLDAKKMKKVGIEVGWIGFPSIAYPRLCFFSGKISSCVFDEDYYLIDGVAIDGVSGGPVFSDIGEDHLQIIASVSAYISNVTGTRTLPDCSAHRTSRLFNKLWQKYGRLMTRVKKKRKKERKKM